MLILQSILPARSKGKGEKTEHERREDSPERGSEREKKDNVELFESF